MSAVKANQEFTFRLRRVFARCVVNRGLKINPERYQVRVIDEGAGKYLAEGILLLATKEDEVYDCPANFLVRLGRKWHMLKAKLPHWCRRFLPLSVTRIWAINKYPEVNVPAQYFGAEFVSFRVMEEKELSNE